MNLDGQHLHVVKEILQEHVGNYEVWAFGSRVHGRCLKPFSDLDLAIITDQPLESECMRALKDAFSDSNLPFRVDVLDWASIDDSFKKLIMQDHEMIQCSGGN